MLGGEAVVTEETNTGCGRSEKPVGIMADSHGQAAAIEGGLRRLREKGCGRIYHLGDVGDSLRPEETDRCVGILLDGGVTTVKGNNDHALVVNSRDTHKGPVSRSSLDYLAALPLTLRFGNAVFAHSLPVERELGLSCMVRTPGNFDMRSYFADNPGVVLFRGHSHLPELLTPDGGRMLSQPLGSGMSLNLTGQLPCMVTCGALTRGHCMIWQPSTETLDCLSFAA
jgi:hypothetical protein